MRTFTYRSAQSGALFAGIILAIAAETLVLHFLLAARHPIVGWTLTLSSLAAMAWLAADYRALGRGAVGVADDVLDLRVGRRFAVQLPVTTVATATRPTWRDLPTRGTPAAAGYLNLTRPADPNVLLTLGAPTMVKLPGGLRRSATRIALHLDAPDDFIAALRSSGVREHLA